MPDEGQDGADLLNDASAGSENSDTDAQDGADDGGEKGGAGETQRSVPYQRFRQVISARNDLRSENERLKGQLEVLQAQAPNGHAKEDNSEADEEPPAHLTPNQKLNWYIQKGVERHSAATFEKQMQAQFGMAPKEVASVLAGLRAHTQESVLSRYQAACTERGVDPKERAIRRAVAAYMQANQVQPEAALDALIKVAGATKSSQPQHSADMLAFGLTGVTAVDDANPRSFEDANRLAREGKAITPRSAVEILRRADTARK